MMRRSWKMLAVLWIVSNVHAQDPQFTQFYANPLYLNPAFAGSNGCPRVAINYRNQWPALSSNFVTYSASFDKYVNSISGGIGVIAMHDQQGASTIRTSMVGLIYSYHLKVTRKFSVLVGARASMFNKFLDWSKLTFGDMIDERRGFIYQTNDVPRGGSRYFFDASAGIIGFSKSFFFGASVHHLNRPDESMIVGNSPLPMRFTGHVGAEIKLQKSSPFETNVSLMPNIIYQYQNGFQELNIGAYLKYNAFTAGVWFRNQDAFILSIGLKTDKLKIGYSYDVTVSRLNNGVSGGSHEVSLGFEFNCREKAKKFKMISCPSF